MNQERVPGSLNRLGLQRSFPLSLPGLCTPFSPAQAHSGAWSILCMHISSTAALQFAYRFYFLLLIGCLFVSSHYHLENVQLCTFAVCVCCSVVMVCFSFLTATVRFFSPVGSPWQNPETSVFSGHYVRWKSLKSYSDDSLCGMSPFSYSDHDLFQGHSAVEWFQMKVVFSHYVLIQSVRLCMV